MFTSRNITSLVAAFILALSISACTSKKKAGDAETMPPSDGTAAEGAPQIDSSPMNFDAAGSDSGKINGLQTVNFDYDKSSLTADSKHKIQSNVEWIKSHPNANVQIEGHCDAKGSIEYNLSLGERRAQAVKSYMAGLGISPGRLSVISYGKEKPLSNGDTEDDYRKNRRANFVPINK